MMKNIRFGLLVFLLVWLSAGNTWAQRLGNSEKISDRLSQRLAEHPNAYQQVMICLKDYIDVRAMDEDFYRRKASLEERTFDLITALKAKAAATQPAVLAQMANLQGVKNIQPAWITNIIFAEMNAAAVYELSLREDLGVIDWNGLALPEDYEVKAIECEKRMAVGAREKGLTAINAHLLWAMGYTGYGKILMGIDTGVDKNHPAIKAQYLGNYVPAAQAWHESVSGGTTPRNCGDHGTHTVGTMVGLDAVTKDTIGVAFGAKWIASPGLCSWSNKYLDFQWALDPDGNASTITDQPCAINNSWYDPSLTNECSSTSTQNIFNAVEAAGIAIVFSAGNNGSGVSTITPPKNISTDLVNVFCVGNLNGNFATLPIASSSSRGPSTCGGTGSLLIKPEVSAPGTDVRSCILNGDYAQYTGTSMAAPHAAGALALLKEAFPTLTGTQLKLALYYTCTDLGAVGEDNDYGMGIINVKAAYDYLVQQGNTPVAANNLLNAGAIQIAGITTPSCKSSINPTFKLENTGLDDLASAWIVYNYDNIQIDSLQWTGLLAHGDVVDISLPMQQLNVGPHFLKVTVKRPNNGTDQQPQNNEISTNFTIIPSYTPIPTPANVTNICANQAATLTATANVQGTIAWYDAPLGGNLLATGSPFVTPAVNGTQSFYVDILREQYIGKEDSAGAGAFQNNSSPGLIFDVFHNCVIKQVKTYASTAGTRIVVLKNAAGAILASDTIDMVVGEQIITLNFAVAPGTNYLLGLTGQLCKLFRSDAGVNYPYKIDEVISIKNSSAGTNKYYYFYDWKVEYGSPCLRNEVTVSTGTGSVNAAFTPSTTLTYLNSGATVNFTDNSVGATSWLWNFGDGATATVQNPSHTYTQAGTYNVSLTANGGSCTGSASTQITVAYSVGIENQTLQNVKLHPNPTTGLLTLETTLPLSQQSTVRFYDVLGKEVRVFPITNATQHLDIQSLPAGTYYVKVVTAREVGITKVVVVK